MSKGIIAVVLILLTGGSWVYLDYLNKQEQAAAEQMRKEMEQARARAVARERFESELFNQLSSCRQAAETANHDYLAQHEKPVRGKPGRAGAPPKAVMDDAVKMLEAAYVECQRTYDTGLKSGSGR